MSFGDWGQAVGRYGVRTLAWLFVIIGPATEHTVPPIDRAQRPGIERLDNRLGADGSDPEFDNSSPQPGR